MFFSKLKENLKKTKESLDIKMSNIFSSKKDIEEVIDALSKAKRNQPEKYVDVIKKSGYDAREAYRKLFEIYRS